MMSSTLRLSIVVPVYNIASRYLQACIESVRRQSDPNWELVLCDDCSTDLETLRCLEHYRGIDPRIRVVKNSENAGIAGATNRAIEYTTGSFVGFLDNDDELAPHVVAEVRRHITQYPDTDMLYTDEDKLGDDGRHCETYFKPDWSPEHIQSCMYVLHFTIIRKALICDVGFLRSRYDGAQDYDLVLRASKRARRIGHIPKILYHWRKIPGSAAEIVNAKPTALLNAKLALKDVTGYSVEQGLLPGLWRVRPPIDRTVPVTILIPTNDGSREIEGRGTVKLLVNCVRSIKEKTTYPNYTVVAVDNGNMTAQTRDALLNMGVNVKLCSYALPPGPFNFAAKFNYCWQQTETENVIILNDDVEIISPEWIEALLEPMHDVNVGIVGARLLHADNTIQHVGVVLGVHDGAAHVYHGFPGDYVGYNGYTHVIRNYSAVTGACMLTKRSLLEQTGGFDEALAVDYNDIDYCLRIGELGYRVVFTPFAELYHFENSTVERQRANPRETELFRHRWRHMLQSDPYYNPNLPKDRHDFYCAV